MQEQKTIIVGLSGGVDSSVAALLLQRAGYKIEALFMKNWEEEVTDKDYCNAAEDLADAQAVANKLGIQLHKVNFSTTYWNRVFQHFLNEYQAGRTPNPDVFCNREIKFGAFLDHALKLGAERIATGHYAGSRQIDSGKWQLLRASDENKDQSYFLYLLNQNQIARSLFPLQGLAKEEVRNLARQASLPTHDKKDSTGICFIGKRRFRDFLANYLPSHPGKIVTPDGTVIGTHQGIAYYTIGQRQGLGIGGIHGQPESAWFVAEKDIKNNRLVVVHDHADPLLMSTALTATDTHWISGDMPQSPFDCYARCRHRQPLEECRVSLESSKIRVEFQQPQRAITPGQAVVFYSNETCLGGATIKTAYKA